MLALLLCLLCVARVAHAGYWSDAALTETAKMRQCLPQTHALFFDTLFLQMRDIPTRRVMEAEAMTRLMLDVRGGHAFCHAMVLAKQTAQRYLDHATLRRSGATAYDLARDGWSTTLALMRAHNTLGECQRLGLNNSELDPFSRGVLCLNARRKNSAGHSVKARHAHEESQ